MSRKGWLLFVAISIVWGIPYLFIKIAVGALDPAVVVCARVGIAAAVLVLMWLRWLRAAWLAAASFAACASLGLRTKYIGAIGDDERGRIQLASLEGTGINLDHVQVRRGCANQSAYIIIDRSTGERTVLWRHD